MPQAVYTYIRNIAVFLIFTGLAGAIVPDGKYRRYVNLTLAVILTLIVAAPLLELFGTDPDDIWSEIGFSISGGVMAAEYDRNDETGKAMALEIYKRELGEQLERLLKGHGDYSVYESFFDIDDSDDNFGAIRSIYLTVSKASASSPGGIPLIRIEPISVGPGAAVNTGSDDDAVKAVKKTISDFYNVPSSNIYITVRKTG